MPRESVPPHSESWRPAIAAAETAAAAAEVAAETDAVGCTEAAEAVEAVAAAVGAVVEATAAAVEVGGLRDVGCASEGSNRSSVWASLSCSSQPVVVPAVFPLWLLRPHSIAASCADEPS